MTAASADRALVDLVAIVDATEHTLVRVDLQTGGTTVTGRLISELEYRRSVTSVVRQGNAAPMAGAFEPYEELAAEKREENARRNAGRPHTLIPDLPEALHIVLEGEGKDGRVWRFAFDAIEGWALRDFGFEVPPTA
ncbi:hypothetical protein ABT272_28345 [Streptomyces sp900105245]|uniref:Uncharacterized protein n=1 Tax=Streptomyces sp. 900105245 TaxID=3154379 RepID=A0ABV1UE62_9ACTN